MEQNKKGKPHMDTQTPVQILLAQNHLLVMPQTNQSKRNMVTYLNGIKKRFYLTNKGFNPQGLFLQIFQKFC